MLSNAVVLFAVVASILYVGGAPNRGLVDCMNAATCGLY
jgi:hypothetical protein